MNTEKPTPAPTRRPLVIYRETVDELRQARDMRESGFTINKRATEHFTMVALTELMDADTAEGHTNSVQFGMLARGILRNYVQAIGEETSGE